MRRRFMVCCFLLVCFSHLSAHALTVILINRSTSVIQQFIFPNGVTFGPLDRNQTVQLAPAQNALLANQVGNLIVVSGYGYLSCGQVYFFDGVTTITIQALANNFINCVVTYA